VLNLVEHVITTVFQTFECSLKICATRMKGLVQFITGKSRGMKDT
jgi:hypothetical protein